MYAGANMGHPSDFLEKVPVFKQTYRSTLHADVCDLDGCPRFAKAYLGRK